MSFRVDLQSQDAPAPRRHGTLVVVLALAAMGVSAALAWAAWRAVSHHGTSAAVPIIHADERPVKVPPVNPGGMTVPDQNIYVLNGGRPDSRVEQLLPPPETPLPRPAPPEPKVMEPAPAAASEAPPQPDAAAAAPPAAPPVASAAPVVAAAPAPAAATPLQPAASASGFFLQLAAVRTPEAAEHEWARLKRAQADILGTLEQRTVRADLGNRGVYYRVEAGPLADGAAAQRACEDLRQRKIGCILVRP
ncbi:MAG TPA: SPOR domain-containing protein [Stellaceae bacterium]|nr:SPOR domain-containing protein [Stellaceae bacterium]